MTVMIEAAAVAGALVAHSPLKHPAMPATWPSRPLGIAALSTWLFDAVSGVFMLGTWIARGGLHQQRTTGDRLAPRVVFTHFGIAITGLLVWACYLVTAWVPVAWLAVGLLMLVIGLGISTVTLWTPFPAHRPEAAAGPVRAAGDPANGDTAAGSPAVGALAAPAEEALTGRLTDEMLNRALTDEVLLSQLVDDVVAGVRAAPPRAGPDRRKQLATIIPAAHGLAAIATFLLAVLTAAGVS
jgi:manganese efflux pump family protein